VNAPNAGPVLVLTALDLEYQAVRAHLTGLQHCSHPAGTLFEMGRLPTGGALTIAATGEGNPGAAVLAERAISMFSPRALLFVGVAGALKNDISLGDVVVATKIYACQGGKEENGEFLARPHSWAAPHELEQLARHINRTQSWVRHLADRPDRPDRPPAVHFKPVAAAEGLLNSRAAPLARRLHRFYNDAVAIEMESAGMAQAGHHNHRLPVLTIRGISDRADGAKQDADQAGWQLTAAAHAAAFAVTLAAELTDDGGSGAVSVIRHKLAGNTEAIAQLERLSNGCGSPADLAALESAVQQLLGTDPSIRAELSALAAGITGDKEPAAYSLTFVTNGAHVGKIASFGQVHGDVHL
jgi:nucleoside phosphorylase